MDSLKFALSHSVKRYDCHSIQTFLYSYDLLKLPPQLRRFVKQPVCVVQPENAEEVVSILKVCRKFNIPVVPRGSGTSAYGGAVTLKSSIVVDFTRMNKFEVKNGCVVAESGVVWLDLEKELNKRGYALRVYPTSAPASTVGGWVAQCGYGVGSLKYGGIGDNVEWLEVADFEGIRRVSGDDLKYYVGLHGTTGLILRVCLKIRENRSMSSYAVRCSFDEALRMADKAYYAVFMTAELSERLGFDGSDLLLLTFEGAHEGEAFEENYDKELGQEIWDNRFNLLKAACRREVILSEAFLPYERAVEFYRKSKSISPMLKAIFTKKGVVFIALMDLENYYRTAARAVKFIKVAEKLGGRVYSTGMLFPHKKIFGRDVVEYKRSVDPENLLNPGKAVQTNTISRIIRLSEMVL